MKGKNKLLYSYTDNFTKTLERLRQRRKFLYHLGRLNYLRSLIERGLFPLERSSFLTLDTALYLSPEEGAKNLRRIFNYLKRHYGLKFYLTASELQERGALHYHIILLNVPFIPREVIAERWVGGLQGVHIEEAENPIDAVFYVLHYLKKGIRVSWSYSFKEYVPFSKVCYCVRYNKEAHHTYVHFSSFLDTSFIVKIPFAKEKYYNYVASAFFENLYFQVHMYALSTFPYLDRYFMSDKFINLIERLAFTI